MATAIVHAKLSKAARVAAEIRRLIARQYESGDMLPRQSELAAQLQVGARSVNAAMRMLQGVVCAVRHKGTVVRRRLSAKTTVPSQVALVLNFSLVRIFTGYAGQIATGLSFRLDELPANLAIFPAHLGVKAQHQEVLASGVDGVALLGVYNPAYLQQWQAQSLPVVVMDHYDESIPLDYVVCDNAGAVEAILSHLYALGHRQIEYVSGTNPDSDNRERRSAFADSSARMGLIGHAPFWAELFRPDAQPTATRDACSRLWGRHGKWPTAIVTDSGYTATKVLNALSVRGIRVPEQVSVAAVAHHNSPFDYASQPPPFTCALMDFRDMGRQAVNLLIDRMHSPTPKHANIVRVGFTLHTGCTTAAPPRSRTARNAPST